MSSNLNVIATHSRDVSASMYSLVDEVDAMREEVMEALAEEKRKSDELHQENLKAAKTDLYKRGWNAAINALKTATASVSYPLDEEEEDDA